MWDPDSRRRQQSVAVLESSYLMCKSQDGRDQWKSLSPFLLFFFFSFYPFFFFHSFLFLIFFLFLPATQSLPTSYVSGLCKATGVRDNLHTVLVPEERIHTRTTLTPRWADMGAQREEQWMWGFKETSEKNLELLKGDHGDLSRQKHLWGESWGPKIRGPLYSCGRWNQDPPPAPNSKGQALSLRPGYSSQTLLPGHGCSQPSEGAWAGQAEGVVSQRARWASTQVETAVVSELRIRSHPDPAPNPTTARPAGAGPGSPIDPRPDPEPLKYSCLFLGLLPAPLWCHFQIHYIPMALGSFNYMWWSLAIAGIRRPVLTIYRPQLSHKQGNK